MLRTLGTIRPEVPTWLRNGTRRDEFLRTADGRPWPGRDGTSAAYRRRVTHVLVTGGAGFIGTHVATALHDAGHG